MVYIPIGGFARFANRAAYSRPGQPGRSAGATVPLPGFVAHCRPARAGEILQGDSENMFNEQKQQQQVAPPVEGGQIAVSPPPPRL